MRRSTSARFSKSELRRLYAGGCPALSGDPSKQQEFLELLRVLRRTTPFHVFSEWAQRYFDLCYPGEPSDIQEKLVPEWAGTLDLDWLREQAF